MTISTMRAVIAVALGSACLGAAAKAPAYDSAFANYKAYEEPKRVSWKETNDKIGAASSHSAHGAHGAPGHDMSAMKQAPQAAPAPKPAPPAKPKADPHAHHNH